MSIAFTSESDRLYIIFLNKDVVLNLRYFALGNVFALHQIEARNSSTFYRDARGDFLGGKWMGFVGCNLEGHTFEI